MNTLLQTKVTMTDETEDENDSFEEFIKFKTYKPIDTLTSQPNYGKEIFNVIEDVLRDETKETPIKTPTVKTSSLLQTRGSYTNTKITSWTAVPNRKQTLENMGLRSRTNGSSGRANARRGGPL